MYVDIRLPTERIINVNYTKTLSLKVHKWTINYVVANDWPKSLFVHIDDVNTLVNSYCDYIEFIN